MYLLRAYYGTEIRETELQRGTAFIIEPTLKSDVIPSGFIKQKKPIIITVEDTGWRLDGLRSGMKETLQLVKDIIPFEKVCAIDNEMQTALAVYCTGSDFNTVIDLSKVNEVTIGRNNECDITIACKQISRTHLRLARCGDGWEFEDLKSANGTYLDGKKLARGRLDAGKELVIGFARLRRIGDLLTVCYNGTVMSSVKKNSPAKTVTSADDEYPYFFRQSPRLLDEIPDETIELQSPPSIGGKPNINWLDVLLAPLLTVAVMVAVSFLVSGMARTLYYSVPMTMIGLIMSIFRYRRQRKAYQQSEQARLDQYTSYINEKQEHLTDLGNTQRRVLSSKNPSVETCIKRADGPDRTLWDRRLRDADFMTLRVGVGSLPAAFSVRAPWQTLTLEQDCLAMQANELEERFKEVRDCPITIDLGVHPVCGVIGDRHKCVEIGKNLLVEATAHLSYDELRIVLIYDQDEQTEWSFVRRLPHIYDDDRCQRYIADTPERAKKLLDMMDDFLTQRQLENAKSEYGASKSYRPFYLFVCASYELTVNHPIIKKITSGDRSLGAASVLLFDRMDRLPNECHYIVELAQKNQMYEKEHASNKQLFIPDHVKMEGFEEYARSLAPVRIELTDRGGMLPTSISFLQGMKVRTPQELGISKYWEAPTPEKSMAVPIGSRADGTQFLFDIHEKKYGPHGLVGGTTGSGKTEMVQSWILSMAVHFPPSAVSFVLIDFKGTGLLQPLKKLPHLAGTLSNLNSSISRNLIALQNELTRREKILDEYGVNKISDYLKLYHAGKAEEPLPYLFIVIDEFAEFKKLYPDFMPAVNSVFAIGRALGVHIILLTQKPGEAADDKMKANTRFRWCLKVANSAESREMLHRPDAAKLTTPGRAFVQVGEDEVFEEIQSFWCGAPYNPRLDINRQRSNKVSVVDIYGQRSSYEPDKTTGYQAEKSEIDAVVEYLDEYCRKNGIAHARSVWTDKLPTTICLPELMRVGFDGENWGQSEETLRLAAGMLDDPRSQSKYPFYLDLTGNGHARIYGTGGSGKTTLVQTLIMSAAFSYRPDELNIYAIDFGGSLNIFRSLPHVGGVVLNGDEERLHKLTQMLLKEQERRRKLISDLGLMNVQAYRKVTGERMPYILLVVDKFAGVKEYTIRHPQTELDAFFKSIAQDGASCGIHMILTANTINDIFNSVAENMKFAIALQMGDKSDYASVVGTTGGLYPENFPGRGLVKNNPPLEVQFALPETGEQDERAEKIRNICMLMHQKWKSTAAPQIPVLPEVVHVADYPTSELLLGLRCDDVSMYTIDAYTAPFLMISSAVNGVKTTNAIFSQLLRKLEIECEIRFDPEKPMQMDDAIAALMPALQDRKDRANGGKLDHNKDRAILILIPDIQSCFDAISNDTARRLAAIVSLGEGLNVIVAVAGDSQQISKLYHGGEQFTMRMVQKGTSILLGGNASVHNAMTTDIPYSESKMQLASNEAYVVRDGKALKIRVVE